MQKKLLISLGLAVLVCTCLANGSDSPAKKHEYVEVEEMTLFDSRNEKIPTMDISTLDHSDDKKKTFHSFEVDLPMGLAKVILLKDINAPIPDVDKVNPVEVNMSIESGLYLANDDVEDLRGCFLSGAAFGNINSSRAQIAATNLNCILVTKDGTKYKATANFPKNKVWIMGEDGSDGVQGDIVDSSGKQYIDVQGGRKNLTVFFGGGIKLKVEEFKNFNIED